MKRYLGVDLHRTQFVVCPRLENGEQEVRQWRIAGLPKFVEQLQSQDQIAVEPWGRRRASTMRWGPVARVVVVNPHQFKVISESVKKEENGSQRCPGAKTRPKQLLSRHYSWESQRHGEKHGFEKVPGWTVYRFAFFALIRG